MLRSALLLLTAIVICLAISVGVLSTPAQVPALRLSGTVFDPSGAIIPGVAVTLSNPAMGLRRSTITNEIGFYELTDIPAGPHELQARLPGFAPFFTNAAAAGSLDIRLSLPTLAEVLTLTTSSPASVQRPPSNRIRQGGHLVVASLLNKVNPIYPPGARSAGIQGAVTLQAVIGLDGSVTSIHPLTPNVDGLLLQAAIDAVSQWRYRPTLLNGQPVQALTTITINFGIGG